MTESRQQFLGELVKIDKNMPIDRNVMELIEKQNKQQQRFLKGYREFIESDRPKRQPIMAEAKAIRETWFAKGVKYDYELVDPISETLAVANIYMYTNMPLKLRSVLEIAFGEITANILQWGKIPGYLCPQLLMRCPAFRLPPYNLKDERKADFEQGTRSLPYGPVFWSEGKPPKERVELVSNNWYDLQAHYLYRLISRIYATESNQWIGPKSRRQVESYLEADQALRDLSLNLANVAEYWACRLGFQYIEVSSMLRALGVNRKPGAVKKSYYYHRELVEKSRGNL
jgi:hypothetical protein